MQVHFETHRREADYVYHRKGVQHTIEQYSVEVTIGKTRRRVSCSAEHDGRVIVRDLAVRFSQGAKVWDANATYWPATGKISRPTPQRFDRAGHFTLVGFYADFAGKAIASQHNGA